MPPQAAAAERGGCRRAARASAFLAAEVGLLLRGAPRESRLEARHAEVLSSLVRRELKLVLNDAVAIVHGTGSVRFNFDDPAALLHTVSCAEPLPVERTRIVYGPASTVSPARSVAQRSEP